MSSFDSFKTSSYGVPLALFSSGMAMALVGVYHTFLEVPPDYQMGNHVRWLFPHVAAAFSAILLFVILVIFTIRVFRTTDRLILLFFKAITACILLFTILTLVTGSMWAIPLWGDFWIWDARTGLTVLFFIVCVGIYLSINIVLNNPRMYFLYLSLVIIAAVVLFTSHQSTQWWNTLHQEARLSNFEFGGYAPEYLITIAYSLGAVLFISGGFILSSVRKRI